MKLAIRSLAPRLWHLVRRYHVWLIGAALLLMVAGAGGVYWRRHRASAGHAAGGEAMFDQLMLVKAYPAARQAIQIAIRYNENEPRYWIKLAQAQGQMRNFAGAGDAYQRALDLQPDNIEALENLAALTVRSDDPSRAKQYYEPLLLLVPNDLLGLLAKAILAEREKRYRDADRIADALLAANPDLDESYLLKARILKADGKRRAGIAVLEKRSETANDRSKLLTDLLQAYQDIGDVTGVRATAVRLAQLHPDDPRYVIESARAFQAQGKTAEAQAALDGMQAKFAGSPIVIGAIAAYWRGNAPPPIARQHVLKLAAGARPAVIPTLANMLIELDAPGDALRLLAPLAAAPVEAGNVEGQTVYARADAALGRRAAAQRRVDDVLDFDATNSQALVVSAGLRLARGDLSHALNEAQLAASGDPTSEVAQTLIARIYAALKNPVLAGSAFANLRQHFPHSIAALRAQTDWLLSLGRKTDALRYTSDFARNHPGSVAAWQLYGRVCDLNGGGRCAGEVRSGLKGGT